MDDRHLTLIQCNVNEVELDLRHIIGRESHLDQSHARYLGHILKGHPTFRESADTAMNSKGSICLLVM